MSETLASPPSTAGPQDVTENHDIAAPRLPEGPRGSWLPTLRLIRQPRPAIEGWVQQYGDPFLLRALNGPLVITETLRKLKAPLRLGDYSLPVGMAIGLSTVLAHHNPATYPDPESFRPERFIERSYSPFEYMPFGGGHRRCIGAAFANYEMAMVLGTLLKGFEFELTDPLPAVPRRRHITIGPSSPVPFRVVGERPTAAGSPPRRAH